VAVATGPAVWDHSGVPPAPLRWGWIGDPARTVAPQALRCTDQDAVPAQLLGWFVPRWPRAVTVAEGRRPLGVATQRQGSARAIRRPTPAVLGGFSLGTRLAHPSMTAGGHVRQAAW